MVETYKPTKSDTAAKSIIDECLAHASLYQEDRRKNWELYEGVRSEKESKQTKFNHVYRSHIGAKSVEQLATFSTQALTNEGGKIFRVADYNNVEVARQAAAATVLLNYYISNIGISEELYKTLSWKWNIKQFIPKYRTQMVMAKLKWLLRKMRKVKLSLEL